MVLCDLERRYGNLAVMTFVMRHEIVLLVVERTVLLLAEIYIEIKTDPLPEIQSGAI